MSSKKPKKVESNGAHRNGTPRRRSYERTTPVGRVKKHLEKAFRIASFAAQRMQAWEHATDTDLIAGLAHARNAVSGLENALKSVGKLFDVDWTPPKKATSVSYSEGEDVRIAAKYRDKYLQIYPTSVIDNLVVAKCLPTGEIAIRHGSSSPFIVAKSHVEKRTKVIRKEDTKLRGGEHDESR